MTRIKVGDYVRMWVADWNRYDYGEVTLIKDGIMCKVLFTDLAYDYYLEHQLEVINPEDIIELNEP